MKFKSIIIMLALLGLGFVMGMLTSGHFIKKQVSKMAKTRTAEGLEEHVFSIIDADDDQKKSLREIIRPYSKELERIRKESMKSRGPILDSMKVEIGKEVSPEQNLKLQKFIDRMKKSSRPKGKFKKNEKKGK